jgi:ABC-2 type transport system ATP-binding protein/nitrous oxidase accessory protein
MIRIENLTKRFGRATAVEGVCLEIAPGESVALWGGNGAGKTTIIRCVLGLIRFRGRISVGGFEVLRRGKRARSLIGYVPQELGFYDDLRVSAAVGFFARLKGVAVPSVDAVLDRVGLGGHGHKRVRELSGGMKQRLALAVALLGDPPVLVLDEVTASLDTCGRGEFVELLSRLSHSGRAMLFASHRVEEVATLASRVVLLERGRVVAEKPAAQFAEAQSASTTLHLHIDAPSRAHAMELLCTHGFEPRLNGVGLLVPVPTPRKAEPFHILNQGQIGINNFKVLGRPATGPGAPRECQP